jgi:sigma-E factor negative regulatory protein RseA
MKSRISAIMDGELDPREADEPLAALRAGGEAREAWNTYHLIGDVLRDTHVLSAGFGARIAARLAEEPPPIAPYAGIRGDRWLVLSAAASVAAVAFVAWVGFGPQPMDVPLAKSPAVATVAVNEEPVRVPPPEAARDYLLAHQGYSPRNSLQGMAPYVRTVSGEAAAKR